MPSVSGTTTSDRPRTRGQEALRLRPSGRPAAQAAASSRSGRTGVRSDAEVVGAAAMPLTGGQR